MLNFTSAIPIQPLQEVIAYEALWADKKTTFKTLSALFTKYPDALPSSFMEERKVGPLWGEIKARILSTAIRPGVLINGTYDYPSHLKDAKEPVELLYYYGILEYLKTRCVAIVGTRNPSPEGLRVATDIASHLVTDDFTVVSGLAAGIDTAAHTAAIAAKGRTIGVIGTPLDAVYPRQNESLQHTIAQEHLLISQVPFYRYSQQNYLTNRLFFLERNKTMSALTEATLIVEAGETSGSLTQATAALYQKRKLLIWEGCFHNPSITWPARLVQKGAIRVSSYQDIKNALG